jgi:hypothetical protein
MCVQYAKHDILEGNLISFFKDKFDRTISLPEKQDTLTHVKQKIIITFTLRYIVKSTYNGILIMWFKWIM